MSPKDRVLKDWLPAYGTTGGSGIFKWGLKPGMGHRPGTGLLS